MKRILVLICSVLVIGAGIWAYMWWQSPAETKEFTAQQKTQGVLGSKTELAAWRTQYFSTSYPNTLRVITSNEVAQGITLGQYLLGTVALTDTDQLAVTVGTLDGMALDELPAVKLREHRSDMYQPATLSFAPAGAVTFTNKNGYETALFWQHDNYYSAVVASGSSARQAELDQELEAIVQNWQWHL